MCFLESVIEVMMRQLFAMLVFCLGFSVVDIHGQDSGTTCGAPSGTLSASHTVVANVDVAARVVVAEQRIRYSNMTDQPLNSLVLNVEPNRWNDVFTLTVFEVNGVITPVDIAGRRLTVTLPEPLDRGCSVELRLIFSLRLPPIVGGPESFRGYFGYSPRQINLGHWLPTVVPFREGEWLHYPALLIGEQIVLDAASWDVTLNLLNAQPTAVVAAPGDVVAREETRWHFTHEQGREFAVSISEVFQVTSLETETGVLVDVYVMPDAIVLDETTGGWIDGGAFVAESVAESITLFAEVFGDFPHDRMVVVQGDFPDGMEFSGFAFVSTDWFVNYTGDPAGYLLLITVHEIAHQWWYDLVGNNQAISPWLDEALSTYSEVVYLERYYPQLVDWWWYFRVSRLRPEGDVDSMVYDFDQIRPYINAVYLRGVMMLHEMRFTLGDDAFFGWLRRYAEMQAGTIGTPDTLWAALTAEQFEATAYTRTQFLRNPGVR